MLGLLNTVLSKGNTLLTYVKDGLVMANRFLTPPKLTFPVDASAEFNGTSDYIDTGAQLISTNHTFAAWVYRDSSGTNDVDYIFDARDAYQDGLLVFSRSHTSLSFIINATELEYTSFTSDEWNFITGTYDGSALKVYVNGSQVKLGGVSITLDTTTDNIIGRGSYLSSSYWDGNLANVAIWNRALSSDEINSVMWKGYDALATSEKNGLQAWYSLEESELLSGDSTATLEKYAAANSLTFEGKQCVQDALNGLPDITDARLHSANYDIRVSADGGNVESLSCVETELNAIL